MSGEVIFPSSVDYGTTGNLAPRTYISTTNTNAASNIEGCGVVASLAADSIFIAQFNLPGTIPTGTCKLRVLAWANATSGAAKLDIADGQTAVGSNIGAATLTTESGSPTISQTWTTADVIVENKVVMSTAPTASNIFTVKATFRTLNWTLAAVSVWQFSLIWE